MCLITSEFYHKKDKNHNVKCLIAQEDILVYKCLDCIDGEYCTPFQYMPIMFTKGKYVYNKTDMQDTQECEWKGESIGVGIHAYITMSIAISLSRAYHINYGTSMHYAVIPKGSKFYIGIDEDIVSNNLIVYRDKRCFDRHYPNIIGVAEYMLKYLKVK